jgi:hypothetical protein
MVLIACKGGLHRYATYNKKFPVFFPFLFPLKRTAQTAGAILMVNGSKDVVWRKEVPFAGQNNIVEGLGGQISPKHTIFWP